MFGKNTRLNPLDLRKQMLIAESELNRAQLIEDWRRMAEEAHTLAAEASTIRSFAAATATLVAGAASFWQKKSPPPDSKPSWLQTILKSAGTISSLWSAFRVSSREQKDK